MPPSEPDFQNALIDVLKQVEHDWNKGNYKQLSAHWDLADNNPVYLAEEAELVMTQWPEISAYWEATQAWNEWILVEYTDFKVKKIDDANALVIFDLRFDLKLSDRPKPIGGNSRTNVILRRVDREWKIHTWIEAPLSPLTYIRKLYELNVKNGPPQLKD